MAVDQNRKRAAEMKKGRVIKLLMIYIYSPAIECRCEGTFWRRNVIDFHVRD